MKSYENQTAAAKHIESLSDYNGDVCCVDSGSNASDPVMMYGREGWTSTPYQNAGFEMEAMWRWLNNQGGACTYFAEVNADGSAEIYQADEDGDMTQCETLPAYCWLDQDMVHAVTVRGDRFHGGNVPETAGAWLDADFDAVDAGGWMDAGVFDADSARVLADAGVTPEMLDDADYDGNESWGYDFANGDVSLADVLATVGIDADDAE